MSEPKTTAILPTHLLDAIRELDAAGFAVVPKKPNTNIVTAMALAYSNGGEGWLAAGDLRDWGICPNAESEWMAGAWRAALAVALVPVRGDERSDIDAYEAALKDRGP